MLRLCQSSVLARGLGLRCVTQTAASSSGFGAPQRPSVGFGGGRGQPRGPAIVSSADSTPRMQFVDVSVDPVQAFTEDVTNRIEAARTANQVLAIFLKAKLRPETGGIISVAALQRLRTLDRIQQMPPLMKHPAFESLCNIFTINAKYLGVGEMVDIACLLMELGCFEEEKLKTALIEDGQRRLGEMPADALGTFLHVIRLAKLEDGKRQELKMAALEHVQKKLDGELSFGDSTPLAVEALSLYGDNLPGEHLEKLLKKTEANLDSINPQSLIPLAESLQGLGEKGTEVLKALAQNVRKKMHVLTGQQLRQLIAYTQDTDPELKEAASSLKQFAAGAYGGDDSDPERRRHFESLQTLNRATVPDQELLKEVLSYFLPRLESEVPVVFLALTYTLSAPGIEKVEEAEALVRAFFKHPQNPDGWTPRQLSIVFLRLMRIASGQPELLAEIAIWASRVLPSRLEHLDDPRFLIFILKTFVENGFYSSEFFSSSLTITVANADSIALPRLISLAHNLRFVPFYNQPLLDTLNEKIQGQPDVLEKLTVPQIVRLSSAMSHFNYPGRLMHELAAELESRPTLPTNVSFLLSNFVHVGVYPKKFFQIYFNELINRPSEQLWANRRYKLHLIAKAHPELGVEGMEENMLTLTEQRLAIAGRRRARSPDEDSLLAGSLMSRVFDSELLNRYSFAKDSQYFFNVMVFDRKSGKMLPCATSGLVTPGETSFSDAEQEDLVYLGFVQKSFFTFMKNDRTHMNGIGVSRLHGLKLLGWTPIVVCPKELAKMSSKEEMRSMVNNLVKAQSGVDISAA